MAHQHQVVDSDIRFTINPVTRAISRVDAKKSSLVVGDHNSERFTFEIPKIVEGHDMSLCNVVRVHYLNTSSDNKSVQSLGVYEVDDFATDPENEDKIKFSWLISRKATQHVGPLAFTIQFACMTGFKLDYSWQSGVFSGITVSDAVNGAEVIIEEYADILRKWWEQLYASSELPIEFMSKEDFEALEGDTKNGMLYMILDDPAIEDLEKIPGIEQNVTTLITDVDNLKEEVAADKQNLTNLDSIVQTNKENIDNLTSRVYTNELSITDFNSAVQTNRENIDNLTPRVQTNEENITNLTPRVQTNEDNITNLTSTVQTNEQRIVDNEIAIESHNTKIADIETELDELNNGVESFYRYQKYTLLADPSNQAYGKFRSGLWLFKVEIEGLTCASVIMDTSCEYSSAFFVLKTTTTTGVVCRCCALKRGEINTSGETTIWAVVFGETSGDFIDGPIPGDSTITESALVDAKIYGRPFGFTNPFI